MENQCRVSDGRSDRLIDPTLHMAGQIPILGLAVDAAGDVLMKTRSGHRVWDGRSGRQRSVVGLGSETAGVRFSDFLSWPGSRLGLAVNRRDGSVAVTSGGRVAAHIRLTHTGWSLVHSSGRFDADQATWKHLAWHDGDRSLGFEQLADLYYEPALLGKLAAGEPFTTASAPAIGDGLPLPPTTGLTLERRGTEVIGKIRVTDRGGCIDTVRLFQNGKAIPVTAPARRAGTREREVWRFTAPLQAGRNEFTALATSRLKIEGQRATALSTLPATEVAGYQPGLHVLAVGIDRYAVPELHLDFAVKDARAIADWAKKARLPFHTLSLVEIYDGEATRERIAGALEQLQDVDPRDTVLVYLAGHGENDGVRWYFLPTEFGREISLGAVSREGLSSAQLRDALMGIRARRVALVIDACKSGDMRRAFSAAADDRYLEWVSRTAGIRLLAATDQEQLAAELLELRHGALTYVLLDGLSGRADTTPSDGELSVGELYGYTGSELPKVTQRLIGSAQVPVVFSYGRDFPLERLE